MASRKLEKRNVRNIQRFKESYYVTLPIEIVRELKWKERQKVVVKMRGRVIAIADWKK